MDNFHYISYAQEVVFGSGSFAQLGEALERVGWQRCMLCTSPSMRRAGYVESVQAALESKLVAVYERVQPHVQDVQVDEALTVAVAKEIDALIGLGGGSPIGMAKALAHALNALRTSDPSAAVAAIPTTYAGSEMTAVFGVTHSQENPPRKVTIQDPRVTPRLVIYDPQVTVDLPRELTASTGINALAHCIEALYSKTRNPLSTAAALSGVRYISQALYECYRDGHQSEPRTRMLLGSHLAGLSLASVSMGLHHGLCHVLGGSADIPHGIANSIILPHAIRFNADVVADQLVPAAGAMRLSTNGNSPEHVVEAMAQTISELSSRMNLPQRLREAGLRETDLPNLARLAFENRTVQNNPKPISHVDQMERLLRDAW